MECTLPVRTCPPILLPDHSFDSIFAFLAGENDSFILIDTYAHIVFINDLDALKLLQFQLNLYRSIALKELYKFAFGCALIGGSVWQQIREVRAGVSAPVACHFKFREFAGERFTGSSWTQKIFDRSLQELSIGV